MGTFLTFLGFFYFLHLKNIKSYLLSPPTILNRFFVKFVFPELWEHPYIDLMDLITCCQKFREIPFFRKWTPQSGITQYAISMVWYGRLLVSKKIYCVEIWI